MPQRSKREEIKQYIHNEEKRLNNPQVGLVTAETDHMNGKKAYRYDPNLDPQLQWAGKSEGTSLEVDTVSLHVHEKIDPLTIIQALRKQGLQDQRSLLGYFESDENNRPIREEIQFYKHAQGWSNRLIAGDSLLVMNSLLEKENLGGKVQMIYMDPPYGIRYGSNFQPFVNKREVRDGHDDDLTQEPEMVKAYRDTWELGIHSYLSYLRDRLLLSRDLLATSGSIFVQISDENVHHVKELMDEVFGPNNFVSLITFRKTSGAGSISGGTSALATVSDYLLWYAKDMDNMKYRQLYLPKLFGEEGASQYTWLELPDGTRRRMSAGERESAKKWPMGARAFGSDNLTSTTGVDTTRYPVEFKGKTYTPHPYVWKTSKAGMERLKGANRLIASGSGLYYVRYLEDFQYRPVSNLWDDTISSFMANKIYVVQTNTKVVDRCVLMTTDPGDIVLDPTCGSGTTAFVAEKWGRRWITCDTSRVALTLAKQRMMTSVFDYYVLVHPEEGVSGGFKYETVPHITLKSIANEETQNGEKLFDRPLVDRTKRRISGPFTVEAVPSQRVRSLEEAAKEETESDSSIVRSGATSRINDWVDELLASGIRGKSGQKMEFARIEILGGTEWVQADAETKDGKRAVISFGPEYAPLEQRQIELAIEEAQELIPKPKLVIFAAFQFDPEAAKDIDDLKWPGVDVLKVQMNTDMFTSDLKKKRSSDELFWLIGQPDIELKKDGKKHRVVVNGFDYYNTKTGSIESGDVSKVAMWELDTDYNGRSLYPRQVFFPMAAPDEGWARLARTLRATLDEELAETYRGNISIPFILGENKQVAVKVIDDRGIESLKIVKVRD